MTTRRDEKLEELHGLNNEYKAITGDSAYLYSTQPESTEYFVFHGPLPEHDQKIPGIEKAVDYMRQRLAEAQGQQKSE